MGSAVSLSTLLTVGGLMLPVFFALLGLAVQYGRVRERQTASEEHDKAVGKQLDRMEQKIDLGAEAMVRAEAKADRHTERLDDHARQLELVRGRQHDLANEMNAEIGRRALLAQRVDSIEKRLPE